MSKNKNDEKFIKPIDFINWAEKEGLNVPKELAKMVRRHEDVKKHLVQTYPDPMELVAATYAMALSEGIIMTLDLLLSSYENRMDKEIILYCQKEKERATTQFQRAAAGHLKC